MMKTVTKRRGKQRHGIAWVGGFLARSCPSTAQNLNKARIILRRRSTTIWKGAAEFSKGRDSSSFSWFPYLSDWKWSGWVGGWVEKDERLKKSTIIFLFFSNSIRATPSACRADQRAGTIVLSPTLYIVGPYCASLAAGFLFSRSIRDVVLPKAYGLLIGCHGLELVD